MTLLYKLYSSTSLSWASFGWPPYGQDWLRMSIKNDIRILRRAANHFHVRSKTGVRWRQAMWAPQGQVLSVKKARRLVRNTAWHDFSAG